MDAQKTGAFIARLRKEKAYTQKELAEKLKVSDKAISRWETGKGFPDTALLKPLSDALEISVGELLSGERMVQLPEAKKTADHIILTSMESANRKVNRIGMLCGVLVMILLIVMLFLGIQRFSEPTAMDFIRDSRTHMHYTLGKTDGGLSYDAFEKQELPSGYEYISKDGTYRYVFLQVPENPEPILSYMHCSGEGMLFGFSVGSDTIVEGNAMLGIQKTSLQEYLKEQGFRWHHEAEDFGRPNLVYIDGIRCNWYVYEKDGVYVAFCISASEGGKLFAYDIGLSREAKSVFADLLVGNPVTLEDPYDLVTADIDGDKYWQFAQVVVTAKAAETYAALVVYINSQFVGKMTPPNPLSPDYRIEITMPGIPITILVTPEE